MKFWILLVFFGFLWQPSALFSAEEFGVVTFAQGDVTFESLAKPKVRQKAKYQTFLRKGDRVYVGSGACEISLAGKSVIRLEPQSSVSLEEILGGKSKTTSIRHMSGKLFVHAETNKGNTSLKVTAPGFVAGVRGTQFLVALPDSDPQATDPLGTGVYVQEGEVSVQTGSKGSEYLVGAQSQIVQDANQWKQDILSEYAKEKMRIFAEFTDFKEANYNLIKEHYLKNAETLQQMKSKK